MLCDGIGECSPDDGITFWKTPPGFPEDECRAQCSNPSKFNCTSPNTTVEYVSVPLFEIICVVNTMVSNRRESSFRFDMICGLIDQIETNVFLDYSLF